MTSLLIVLPLTGACVTGLLPLGDSRSKVFGLAVSLATLSVAMALYATFDETLVGMQGQGFDRLGLGLAYDGVSLPFVLLTAYLTPLVLVASWGINNKVGGFIGLQLLTQGLLMCVFLVTDLLSFYVAFEAALIPLFIVVGSWGAGGRVRSAYLLFLYTLAGSLFMLIAVGTLYLQAGTGSFNVLINLSLESQQGVWFAVVLAFAVKTPLVPFHMWLPRAHADAPLAASMVLAGTVLKMASYGFLRLCLGIIPVLSNWYGPGVCCLAVISLVYSSLATLRQTDIKALIAYSSIGHIAITLLGVYSNSVVGLTGASLLCLAHGVVSPALFVMTGGVLYDRCHTRLIHYYRGLTLVIPVFSVLFFVATVLNMGQPLSLNWAGELLCLIGLFQTAPPLAAVASTTQVLSACYAIWLYVRITGGSLSPYINFIGSLDTPGGGGGSYDVTRREYTVIIYLLAPALVFGVWTVPLTNIIAASLSALVTLFTPLYCH